MAESELSVTYADLLAEVAIFVGYGADSASWSSSQLAELDRYVQSGLRQFYYPTTPGGAAESHPWSFLNPVATLVTTADDAAQDLPSNCNRVLGGFHYAASVGRPSVVKISEEQLNTRLACSVDTGAPQFARVRYKPQEANKGQRLEVAWWPIPDDAYTFTYQYEAYSGKLSEDNKYPLGGMRFAEVLIESCLAVAEQRANDERGIHSENFERLLISAIQQDRRAGTRYYGPMGAPRTGTVIPRHGDTGSDYPITYKGTTY